MEKIKNIIAYEILDSRGVPTIRTKIIADNGLSAEASVPSGSSTGIFEAQELRDNDNKRYYGKGVLKAVSNVNDIIAPKLEGHNIKNQEKIDNILIELDGTPQKKNLGGNAILSVSLACARLAALSSRLPLYKYLNNVHFDKNELKIPTPFSVIIEGGKHSSGNMDVQEFILVPMGFNNFDEEMQAISEIYSTLALILERRNKSTNVGMEGAYGPNLKTNVEALEVIVQASEEAGYKDKIKIALDVAASEFYIDKSDESYHLKSESLTLKKQQLLGLYNDWISNFPIFSIEDGLEQNDWNGWAEMTERFSDKIKIIGDDLFVTNPKRIKKGIELKAATGSIIKFNQIGTLSETIEAIKLVKDAGWEYVISHRSGETCDTFISDLAVSCGANYIKTGAPSRGERVEKYNRLLEINKEIK